jgi:hypothetical protein
VTGTGAVDRILEALAVDPSQRRVWALGWATVDLDRAAAELASELGLDIAAFLPAPDSIVLGARCRVADGVLPGDTRFAILEPATEGLLAGALARHGEGPLVTWVRSSDAATRRPARVRPGPFGPERLQTGRPPQGPFLVLIEGEPGTIHT